MTSRSLPSLFLLVLACFIRSATADFEFRVGAVLTNRSDGTTGEMRDARHGYELFFDMANNGHMYPDFMMLGRNGTEKLSMKYEFLWKDDNSDKDTHEEQVHDLVDRQNLAFLLGSHPNYARQEMETSDEGDLVNFQCCVGLDSFYRQGYKRVFGMHVSNRRYVTPTVKKLSIENVTKLWIVVDESNNFTNTTCEAALDVETFEGRVSENMAGFVYSTFNGSATNDSFLRDFAKRAKNNSVEAVIACVSKPDGKILVDAFHDIKYPLKAFFLTAGPASREWVDSIKNKTRTDSLLSAAQWHRDVLYEDEFFGNGSQYVEKYKGKYKEEPSHISASASATGLILHYALKEAFEDCDLSRTNGSIQRLLYDNSSISCGNNNSGGITGYERVVNALRKTDRTIFFGKVKFNRCRRNVGNTPVTTQVLWDDHDGGQNDSSPINAVLPLNHASTNQFRFPAKNYYDEECKPGEYINDTFFYKRCQKCKKGSVSENDESTNCESCPLGTYMDKAGESKCLPCPSNTTTSQTGSTARSSCICKKGYYSLSRKNGEACKPCPHGAICDGNSSWPYPEKHFWMNKTWPDTAYPCDPGSVCRENFTCRPGNTGRLCAECDKDYYSTINRCFRCPHKGVVVFLLVCLVAIWYLINVVISSSLASLEILLDWAQLANIIGDIDLNWPSRLLRVFGIASVLDFDVNTIQPTCLVENWSYRENLGVQLCLPLVITLFAFVGYLLSAVVFFLVKYKWLRLNERSIRRLSWFVSIPNSKEDLSRKWDSVFATFFASVNVTYITLTKYSLDAFKCQDAGGLKFLKASPSVTCDEDSAQHRAIVILGVIGLCFYVLGYVLYTTWTLFYLRKNEAFHKEKYITRYGFMYQNFEVTCFLTPIFTLIQKLLFVVVLVFFNEPILKIGALAMIVIASMMIQVSTNPYLDTRNDVLVTFLLLTLMFEAFGGLMLYNNNLTGTERSRLEWIILIALLLLFLVFLAIFFIEMANKYFIYHVKISQRAFAAGKGSSDLTSPFYVVGTAHDAENYETAVPVGGTSYDERQQTRSLELVDTFRPWYVYRCMQRDPNFTEDWDRLTDLFSGFISRDSSASYWSLRPSAKFWRRMVKQFPEIVDFLAVVDEETIAQFNDIAKRLYKDFFLANEVLPLPLMKLLNWRDRAPMAHWLSVASQEDKQFFLKTIGRLLTTIEYKYISDSMYAKMQERGHDGLLRERIPRGHMNRNQRRNMDLISKDSTPFETPTMVNMRQRFAPQLEMRTQNTIVSSTGPRTAMTDESSVGHANPENIERIAETSGSSHTLLLANLSQDLPDSTQTQDEEVSVTTAASSTGALTANTRSISLNNRPSNKTE